jgi:hypothetical protein
VILAGTARHILFRSGHLIYQNSALRSTLTGRVSTQSENVRFLAK